MKRYLFAFLVLSLTAVIYLSYPFNFIRDYFFEWSFMPAHFVTLEKNNFRIDGKDFYPLVLNYKVSLQTDGKELWACPIPDYNPGGKHLYTTKDSCFLQVKAEMELIKDMGFNTVRIVGIGEAGLDKQLRILNVRAAKGNAGHENFTLSFGDNYEKYFNSIENLLSAIDSAGLKVILLIHTPPGYSVTENHLMKVATRFKYNSTIMAYDLFNEPLYFDSLERKKEGPKEITKRWENIIRNKAPYHLFTIGLAGVREVFEWDPNIISADFISFHPYEYEPEQVRNEIYWYGTYLKKPWIIGETGHSADNDSITYEEQKKFAHETLKQVYNCGGSGYSWWQYKDVDWKNYHANFLGVVNGSGQTKNSNGNLVYGTPKPVADEYRNYRTPEKKDTCLCMDNYYNYSGLNKFKLTGTLTDEQDKPISGGVILAWDEFWVKSYYTFTKADGTFELHGDFPYYHWMASATEFSMVRGDVVLDSAATGLDGISAVEIGRLKINRLSL